MVSACVAVVAVATHAQSAAASGGVDRFVTVRDVRLHFVDWGGTGKPLIFLTALGGLPEHEFDAIAPRFKDHFHVFGLTRRGQGQSDKPASGYGLDSLAADIVGFMDALHLTRASLAAHSIGGAEMTRFAINYPDRVEKVVYLDAAIDYAQLDAISTRAGFEAPSDMALRAIAAGAAAAHPDYSKVKAPALDVVVVYDRPWALRPTDSEAYRRYTKLVFESGFLADQITQFRTQKKNGQFLMLRHTDHTAFLHDPDQLMIVVSAIRRFLLGGA